MQNILRYLTPEILAWQSGNIREVRPLGSVLCLPDGREFRATGTSCKKAEQTAARQALAALQAKKED